MNNKLAICLALLSGIAFTQIYKLQVFRDAAKRKRKKYL